MTKECVVCRRTGYKLLKEIVLERVVAGLRTAGRLNSVLGRFNNRACLVGALATAREVT
jgi:hypothetical protein